MTRSTSQLHRSQGYWTIALGRLARNGWGMVGLAVIVTLLAIAVLAPFLASSYPIVMMSTDPVVGTYTRQLIFEPGLSFPLFAALGRQDLLVLLIGAALAVGSTFHLVLRRTGRSRRTALATSVVSVGLPLLVLSGLILGLYESRRALLDHADFHEVERSLGKGEWSIWPPVRYGPDYLDKSVDSWLRPPWLGRSESEEAVARELAPDDWEARVGSHFLGTARKKDVLSMLIHGTRISLSVGFVAVSIYIVIGVILGALAGFYGGRVDGVIMRLIEVVTCFPSLVLVVAIAAVYPPSIYLVMVVISLVSWPFVARLVRAEFLRLREQEFVQAAIALGASDRRVIFRHILPNAIAPVLVAATFGVAASILVESALSFLGIGVPVTAPTWGNLLRIGREFPRVAWWVSVFPGLAILVTILSYNLLAEALRDALDPRRETT